MWRHAVFWLISALSEMDNKKIKIGAIGCSSIAAKAILPAVVGGSEFELVAVGSRNPTKASEFSSKFDCEPTTYEGILNDSRIDAVYVSLPTGLHAEWGMKVLDAGKHLLLEKTFTRSLAEASDLVKKTNGRELVAMESLQYVHHPLYEKTMEVVRGGGVGDVLHVEAQFGIPQRPDGDIRNFANLGGGAILDTLVYPLSFALGFCAEEPQNIHAHGEFDVAHGVDSRGFVQIDWPGMTAQIAYGFGLFYRNHFCVWGSRGVLSADRVFTRPKDHVGSVQLRLSDRVEEIPVPAADPYAKTLEAFCRKIFKQDTSGTNEGEDILRRMAIIEKVMEKSHDKR